MSSGMIGADPQALRDLASKFDNAAQDLRGTKGSIQTWVDRVDIWRGLDNNQFANDWACTASPALLATSEALIRYAEILRQNADAQDQTSIDYGNTSSSGLFCSEDAATPPAQSAASKSASELFRKLHNQDPDSADGVRIEKVLGDDNVERFIVYINGTNQGAEGTHTLLHAAQSQMGRGSDTYELVRNAMLEAGIKSDSHVLYVGYSQGGMVAQNLAFSGEFGTGVVLAQGSPRTASPVVGYDIIHINRSMDEITNGLGAPSAFNDHIRGAFHNTGFDYVHTYEDSISSNLNFLKGEMLSDRAADPLKFHKDMDAYGRAVLDFENSDHPDAKKSRDLMAPFLGGNVLSDSDRPVPF